MTPEEHGGARKPIGHGAGPPKATGVGAPRRIAAQSVIELRLLLRNGENLLVTLGIPVALLVFFGLVPVLPADGSRVGFLVPGVLTVAVMGAAMVSLGISTGFERSYLVLKRLGSTPLRRGELIAAKALSVVAVEVLQVVVLVGVGLALGWRPDTGLGHAVVVFAGILLATAAFAGIGLALAGGLPALGTLAATNALFLFLLLVSGLVFPLDRLPDVLGALALAFPPAWLGRLLRVGLGGGELATAAPALLVLAGWAVGAPLLAAKVFRWE